jgi:hypothetical protein
VRRLAVAGAACRRLHPVADGRGAGVTSDQLRQKIDELDERLGGAAQRTRVVRVADRRDQADARARESISRIASRRYLGPRPEARRGHQGAAEPGRTDCVCSSASSTRPVGSSASPRTRTVTRRRRGPDRAAKDGKAEVDSGGRYGGGHAGARVRGTDREGRGSSWWG